MGRRGATHCWASTNNTSFLPPVALEYCTNLYILWPPLVVLQQQLFARAHRFLLENKEPGDGAATAHPRPAEEEPTQFLVGEQLRLRENNCCCRTLLQSRKLRWIASQTLANGFWNSIIWAARTSSARPLSRSTVVSNPFLRIFSYETS